MKKILKIKLLNNETLEIPEDIAMDALLKLAAELGQGIIAGKDLTILPTSPWNLPTTPPSPWTMPINPNPTWVYPLNGSISGTSVTIDPSLMRTTTSSCINYTKAITANTVMTATL